MSAKEQAVSEHYGFTDLGERILAAIQKAGVDLSNLTVDDLAPVDEFHIRGRASTVELASLAEIASDELVLDVGSGLGGTARYLASGIGCEVVGLDLTEEYCRIAEMLTEKVDLADRICYEQGSALEMPFPDNHFDVAWTEHVQMNIADKAGFYREIQRVLKPGGRLAFHDVFSGPEDGLHFPVPWAGDASISHLVSPEGLQTVLDQLGYERMQWVDKTEASASFFNEILPEINKNGWRPLSLHLLAGEDPTARFANVLRNLEEDRLRVIQAVLAKPVPRRLDSPG
jgi:MPBQ/MSBQ methyltransferase